MKRFLHSDGRFSQAQSIYGMIFCQAICVNSKYNKYRKWQSYCAFCSSNIHMVHRLTTVAKVIQYISCLVMVAITLYWILWAGNYICNKCYYVYCNKRVASLLISATGGSNTTVLFAREYSQQVSYVVTVSALSLKIFNVAELHPYSVRTTCLNLNWDVELYVHTHAHTHTHIHTHTQTNTHTHVHTRTYTHTCTHTRTYRRV